MTTATAAKERKRRPQVKPAPSLAEVQSRFQAAVIAGDNAVLDLIPGNSRTSRDVLLGVYRHAYVARLVEIVASDHPLLARFMGEGAFGAMARSYIAARPSRTPNARWFAHGVPEHLAAGAPFSARPELAELARLERALNDAFDASDAALLGLDTLAKHAPERWGNLTFAAHPSVARLDVGSNVFALWRALKDDTAPPPVAQLAERERLIVWRNGTVASARVLGPEEAMLWDEAQRGVRFCVLCELAATYADAEGAALRAAQYLQGWIAAGMLTGARLKPRRRRAAGARK